MLATGAAVSLAMSIRILKWSHSPNFSCICLTCDFFFCLPALVDQSFFFFLSLDRSPGNGCSKAGHEVCDCVTKMARILQPVPVSSCSVSDRFNYLKLLLCLPIAFQEKL